MTTEERITQLVGNYKARTSSSHTNTVPFTIIGFDRYRKQFPVQCSTFEGIKNGRPANPVRNSWTLESIEEMLQKGTLIPLPR